MKRKRKVNDGVIEGDMRRTVGWCEARKKKIRRFGFQTWSAAREGFHVLERLFETPVISLVEASCSLYGRT